MINIIRTPEEIQNRWDYYCYQSWCDAQSGRESSDTSTALSLLSWLQGKELNYNTVYSRGEEIYKQGFSYMWDPITKSYIRYILVNKKVLSKFNT